MEKEMLEKQIEEQLKRFEEAIECPFNEEINERMLYVRDGIVNVEAYLNAPVKVLWILKEVNSSDNSLDDMRNALIELNANDSNRIDKGWGSTWAPVAYTTYGIFNRMSWKEIPDIYDNASEVLKFMPSIAQINIKKYAGGATANDKEIQDFYKKYKDLLHEQIELINPDVLIFCGTFKYFNPAYFDGKEEIQERIYKYKNKLLIDTYHPNNKSVTQQNFCDFIINTVNTIHAGN